MKVEWTKEQQKAIKATGNVLVAAAAGSGKTAVLVERVIERLTGEEPIDADKLLIVTFTNAAAREMKTRIEQRLDEECRKYPSNTRLLYQKQLLGNSKICTIDSFCIDLVRENFEKAGVSPDFKMSDGNSLIPVNNQVLDRLLDRYYKSKDRKFIDLVDFVGAEYDEGNFKELVTGLYDYSRHLVNPTEWFLSLSENYSDGFGKDNIWRRYAVDKAKEKAEQILSVIAEAVDLMYNDEECLNKYLTDFEMMAEKFNQLKDFAFSGDWDGIYNFTHSFVMGKAANRNKKMNLKISDALKEARNFIKAEIEKLSEMFCLCEEATAEQFKKISVSMKLLSEILINYERELFEEYLSRNTLTFHNTEYLALKLLTEGEDVSEFSSRYEEIMVDEYQDINDLQDAIFYILSDKGKKLFTVGDVKQSIYGFRGANPMNFLKKKNKAVTDFEDGDDCAKKVVLGNNFRSREEICDYVNFFFENLMTDKTGSIVYDSEEMLKYNANYPETSEKVVSSYFLETDANADEAFRAEARFIGKKIKEIMSSGRVIFDPKNGMRNAEYSDFTILLRSLKNRSSLLADELRSQGIPVLTESEKFADSNEVLFMLSLLRVVDNPDSDIDLLTVMMSPIFGFTPDFMAELRIANNKGSIYSALVSAAENGNGKVKSFIDRIARYRLMSVTLPLYEFISSLLLDTDCLNTVSAYSDGDRRRKNLLLLVNYAKGYCEDNDGTPGKFAEFIVQQSEKGLKAASADFSGDAVRIMSIHSSKGLQFPVCIVANTNKEFNESDSRHSAVYSSEYGIGFKYFDEEKKVKTDTVSKRVIGDDLKRKSYEEELRLFYVAMTRAKDKLIFTGTYSSVSSEAEKIIKKLDLFGGCADKVFGFCNSYGKMLILTGLLHPDGKNLREVCGDIIPLDTKSRVEMKIIQTDFNEKDEKTVETEPEIINLETVNRIRENAEYVYLYEDLLEIESKASVSELANKAQSDKYAFSDRPAFMSDGGLTAAERGTATHKVMQFIDFENAHNLDDEIERLFNWQFITENEADAVNRKALKSFFDSQLFSRIKNSPNKKREMRFLTELPVTEIAPDIKPHLKDEKIIVQGAVDLCFEEDDGITVLDFKTDRTESAEELKNAYGKQLSIYSAACEKIFGKKVKHKIIYSFSLSRAIELG